MTTQKQKNFWKGKGTNENEHKMTNAKCRHEKKTKKLTHLNEN